MRGFLAGCSDSDQTTSVGPPSPRSRASSSRWASWVIRPILAGLSARARGVGGLPRRRDHDPGGADRLARQALGGRCPDLPGPGARATWWTPTPSRRSPTRPCCRPGPATTRPGARTGPRRRIEEPAGRPFQYTDIAAGVSRAGEQVRHRPHGAAAGRVGPGAGLPARRVLPARPTSTPPSRPGSSSSPPRPGPSSTPWPGSSRAGTGTATARPITGLRPCWARTRKGSATRPSWPGQPAWASIATSTRSCSMPTAMAPRIDSPAVRRGPPGRDRLEGLGPPGMRSLRRGGCPRGVPQRQGGHADRPCRAGRARGRAGTRSALRPCPARNASTSRSADLGNALVPQRTQLLALRRRLARRGQARALRPPARCGDRPGPLPGQPGERESPPRRERSFPMLPVRTSQMGQGTSRPDLGPRRRPPAMVRCRRAGPCWPNGSCRACGSRMPPATWGTSPRARVAALAGEDPQAALREVADAWTARTKSLGPERQLWHYRRSLNSLTTLPQPPPRGK